MEFVVLICGPMEDTTEHDMRRWWQHRCKKFIRNGETYFAVGAPKRIRLYEGVKRLRSFGVAARVARRDTA